MSQESFPQAPLVTSTSLPDILENLTIQQKKNRLPIKQVIEILSEVGEHWLNPNYSYRQEAEKFLPSITGYSKEMIRESLDITFQELTQEKLTKAIESVPSSSTPVGLVTQVIAGNIFTSGLFGIVYGLLAQTPQFIKTSSKEPLFPFLFAQSLKEINPVLSDYLWVCSWRGGDSAIENILFKNSSLVIAYGNDETIDNISKRISSPTRFLGFGHNISFGIIGKESMTKDNVGGIAEKAAYDISMYDQQGCLSPHFFYVERSGEITPTEFAKVLSEKMSPLNKRLPRGKISLQESSAIIQQRGIYEFRKIKVSEISIYSSTPSTDWTVVYTEEQELNMSCLNRFVFIKPFSKIDLLVKALKPLRGKIQCIGLGVSEEKGKLLKESLARLKAHRYCSIGNMQRPAIEEIHTGKPNMENFLK